MITMQSRRRSLTPKQETRGAARLFQSGRLIFEEPCREGQTHGIARQWSEDGRLIGTYSMDRGTGVDIWRQELAGEPPYVSEIRYFKDGKRDGFEWWVNADRKSVWLERHFRENQLHGIERSWNFDGALRRGFQRYWIEGERVTKRQYLRARVGDPTLPPFRVKDTRSRRSFLAEIIARQTPPAPHS